MAPGKLPGKAGGLRIVAARKGAHDEQRLVPGKGPKEIDRLEADIGIRVRQFGQVHRRDVDQGGVGQVAVAQPSHQVPEVRRRHVYERQVVLQARGQDAIAEHRRDGLRILGLTVRLRGAGRNGDVVEVGQGFVQPIDR